MLIIGSGFSGLGMAIALQKEGTRKYLLLEKAASLGGTWRENRDPGCACDVPSHLYSFSFAPNADWSHHFAPQEEILQYLQRVAEQHAVLANCRFNRASFSCSEDEWISFKLFTIVVLPSFIPRQKGIAIAVVKAIDGAALVAM